MSEWTYHSGMPVQPFVNTMLTQAVQMGASDIHIEPMDKQVRVRFRIDGILQTVGHLETTLLPQVSARIKVMSHMDIANTRLPMDGRCVWKGNHHIWMYGSAQCPPCGEKKLFFACLRIISHFVWMN